MGYPVDQFSTAPGALVSKPDETSTKSLLITHQGPPRCGLTNLAISAVFQRDGHGTQSHPIPEGSF